MLENFKSLREQLVKAEERANVLHDRTQQLEKLNSQLRSQVTKSEADLTASQQRGNNAENEVRELTAVIKDGKDFNNQKLIEVKNLAERDRKTYTQKIESDAEFIKNLTNEVNSLKIENEKLKQFKDNKKFAIKQHLNDIFSQMVRE